MIRNYQWQLWIKSCLISFTSLAVAILFWVYTVSAATDNALEYIPDTLVSFEHSEYVQYAVLVEKETQHLILYAYDGSLKKVFEMNCSTGEVPGSKLRSGDKKTPEGVYFFTDQYEKKYLSPIYGSRAFPIDYPNPIDIVKGKNGNSIWLHGTNKPIKARDSNGCVALADNDIDQLAKHIKLNRTPIIILKKISYISSESVVQVKESILSFLVKLNDALENGTYHDYLECYASEYLPDISWWTEWRKIKKEFKRSDDISVEMKKVSVFRHEQLFVALFDQIVRSGDKDLTVGTRKLFIEEAEGQYKIVGDVYQDVAIKTKDNIKKNPLVYAGYNLRTARRGELEIEELIDSWLKAWSSQDIREYGEYYASDFRFRNMDREAWLKHKKSLRNGIIKVTKDNLVIKKEKDQRKVTFVQKYESTQHSDVGLKLIKLKREGGRWKIFRETWRKM